MTRSRSAQQTDDPARKQADKPRSNNLPLPDVPSQRPGPGMTPLTTSHVQQMQRTAGNRATVAHLQSRPSAPNIVQRKIVMTTEELPKPGIGQKSYAEIVDALRKYRETADPQKEQGYLGWLEENIADWLRDHATSEGERSTALRSLLDQVRKELTSDTRQQEYLERIRQTKTPNADPESTFQHLSKGGRETATRLDAPIKAQAQEHGISDAELTGIRIFSAPDYNYINPTLARDTVWLTSRFSQLDVDDHDTSTPQGRDKWNPDMVNVDRVKKEGRTHGQMARAGMDKLPNWIGETVRGTGRSEEEFKAEYNPGKIITYPQFTSTSSDLPSALSFANMGGRKYGVAILLHLRVTKGKNIKDLSISPSEEEITLLPGAQFRVEEKPTWDAAAKLYHVYLQQIS